MNLRLKRWITAGAALAMVATMGLSACSTNRALTSETGKNEVTMASRTPNWIFPISAKTGEGVEAWANWLKKQVRDWTEE